MIDSACRMNQIGRQIVRVDDAIQGTPMSSSSPRPSSNETESGNACIWTSIRQTAQDRASGEPMLASFLHATILNHDRFEDAVSYHLAAKLDSPTLCAMQLREIILHAMGNDSSIASAVCDDIRAVQDRDPAINCCLVPLLYVKGVHALTGYRIAHWLWNHDHQFLALHLQNRISEAFAVDIHPAARIGRGILMDHATSVVVGETAVIEDEVSLLHEVTLGGTGKATGDRHPKVRRGVLIGAGAKILGNVEIGEGAKIGAGSVVLRDVPAHCTVAGVPAVVVGHPKTQAPALDMNHEIADGI
ncbi:MAG: serine O-acetyltransferase [Planctomycetaceae bacterium]|nr:serine O-acetyltransferase [Planctomycetaceae bacterium]